MGEHFKRRRSSPDVSTGDAHADRDGAEDVQAERVRLPQYERRCSEEQANDHVARTQGCGGGHQEPLPPEEVAAVIQSRRPSLLFTITSVLSVGVRVHSFSHTVIFFCSSTFH